MTDRLALPIRYRRMVEELLREHVPDAEVWAYGSRVSGQSHEGSDLDLVVRGPELKPLGGELVDLVEAFRESNIPILVQVHDWARLPESFHREIERNYAALDSGTSSSVEYDWHEVPFDQAVQINPSVRLDRGNEYPFVGMAEVDVGSRSVFSTESRTYKGGGSRFVSGDTLMARITPCLEHGKIARFCPQGSSEDGHGSTEFIVIRGRPDVTDNEFAYYLTQWQEVRDYAIGQMTGTSGRQRVPVNSFGHFLVNVPPIPEQRHIARVLGTLDDKIELTRRMNETLEAMAQALFKSWFVDFNPVRAKLEGRWRCGESFPGLPAEHYDLFPDRMVDSELGEIPEGWSVKALGDELKDLVSGSRPRGGAVDTGTPSIGAENVAGLGNHDFSKEKYVPGDFFEKLVSKGAAVRNGDVLLYKDGARLGRKTYLDCGFPYTKCAINEHVFVLRMLKEHAQKYLFFWLDQAWMTREIADLNSNSAQPGINKSGVRGLPILIPRADVLAAFDSIAGCWTNELFANCHENRTLTALRDSLLPKLVSGEIRISVAQQAVDSVN